MGVFGHRRVSEALACLAAVAVLGACVGSERGVDESRPAPAGPGGSGSVPVTEGALSPDPAETPDQAECRAQFVGLRRSLLDRFRATGAYPSTPGELASAGLDDFPHYTVEPRPGAPGSPPLVVPSPDSPCPADPPGGFTNVGVADQACAFEWRTLRTAVEAYRLITGDEPASVGNLVDEGLLDAPSELYEVVPGGEVVPLPGSRCL